MIKIQKKKLVLGILIFILFLGLCAVEIKVPGTGKSYANLREEARSLFSDYGARAKSGKYVATEAKTQDKVVYLTFDDGPSKYTERILDILKENGAHATFFLIGSQVDEESKEILVRMLEEEHEIGIHTYSHDDGIYRSKQNYLEDFYEARDIIVEKLSYEPEFYRFPWGSANKKLKPMKKEVVEILESEGYEYVDWNVSAEDSVGKPSVDKIIRNIKKDLTGAESPVVLMHDSSINENTVKALPEIIQYCKEQGYRFDILKNRNKPCQFK